MKIIKYANMREFDNTLRTYYNLQDVRIVDVHLHNETTQELYHTHETITEILFVIEGNIHIHIKRNDKIEYRTITTGNMIVFEPNEVHYVFSDNARVIVFKYIKTNENLLETFINDWRK